MSIVISSAVLLFLGVYTLAVAFVLSWARAGHKKQPKKGRD